MKEIRNYLNIICITLLLTSCNKYKEIKKFNTDLINTVKENSLFSNSMDWSLIEKEIDSLSKDNQSIDQNSVIVNYIITKLRAVGDYHTFHLSKEKAKLMSTSNTDNRHPSACYKDNDIALIYIPGFSSLNDTICKNFARNIQNIIKTMDSSSVKGWIVDLRENTGGNMYPMIAGLGPLLDEGILGYFIDRKGAKVAWSYYKGQAANVTINKPYKIKNKNAKIAVLISNRTGSSGEMTAISFIGNHNTKIFGQISAGLTTSNRGFMLTDSSYIYLATSIAMDKNKKKYYDGIIPDVYVCKYNTDDCVNEAVKWINEPN